jgi:hypothetical protein
MAPEEQTKSLSLKAAYAFGAANGLDKEMVAIRDMVIEWDAGYTSSLRKGYVVELFESRGLMEKFKDEHWAVGKTPFGESKRKRYLRIKSQYENFLSGRTDEADPTGEKDEEEADDRFAAETDLRDFLAHHPGHIEKGLKLYGQGEQSGVEFPIDGGFIDLLCVDKDGKFVVVELKVGRGRNKTIGQLLYYMGWVDKNLKGPCRGIIIAKDIQPDLQLAVKRVDGVSLFNYKMSVTVEPA